MSDAVKRRVCRICACYGSKDAPEVEHEACETLLKAEERERSYWLRKELLVMRFIVVAEAIALFAIGLSVNILH